MHSPRVLVSLAFAITLASCVDASPREASVEQSSVGDESTPLQEAADWAGALSNYYTAALKVIEFAISYGEETPEHRMLSLLAYLYDESKHVEDLISYAGSTAPRAQVGADVSAAATASIEARRDLQMLGHVPDYSAVTYLNQSQTAVEDLTTNAALWQHIYTEQITYGEWLTVTGFRPPITYGSVWDYRWALPALMATLAMRLNVIAAADPTRLAAHAYDGELLSYRQSISDAKAKIEAGLACGYSIAFEPELTRPHPFGGAIAYHVHIICGDPYTGTEVVTVMEAVQESPKYGLAWSSSADVFAGDDWTLGVSGVTVGMVRNEFWAHLSEHGDLGTQMYYAYRSNLAQLRSRLGLFEMQRTIDLLSTMVMQDPGPLSYDRVRSAFTNICLAHTLSLSGGWSLATTAPCDTPTQHSFGQAWWWDPEEARLQSQSTGACLSISGPTPWLDQQYALVETCDGSDKQRWSYDPTTKRLRSADGMVLDITNGNTAPGADVWTYFDTGNPAQQWGFRSPWTTTGTGGPHL